MCGTILWASFLLPLEYVDQSEQGWHFNLASIKLNFFPCDQLVKWIQGHSRVVQRNIITTLIVAVETLAPSSAAVQINNSVSWNGHLLFKLFLISLVFVPCRVGSADSVLPVWDDTRLLHTRVRRQLHHQRAGHVPEGGPGEGWWSVINSTPWIIDQ